jgi:hypothetical protein
MSTTIRLDKDTKNKFRKLFLNPFKDIRQYWTALLLMIDRDTQLTFRGQGARKGKPGAWEDYSPNTLVSKSGTWNIRYGTDLRGRPKGSYIPGKLRRGIRRYSFSSKLLQASGMFRKSFGLIKMTRRRLEYGTQHKLAEDIMGTKNRNVLHVTASDEKRYLDLFGRWYVRGMRI